MSSPFELSAFAFETITVPSANVVAVLRRGTYDRPGALPCRKAVITVDPGPVISWCDVSGVTVTSTSGHKLTAFGSVTIEGMENIKNFQTTSVSSATVGLITVTYYR